MGQLLKTLADSDQRLGLIVFAEDAYEMLPPGTRGDALRPMLRYYRQPLWLAPLLPFTAFLYLLMTVDSAVQHYWGRGAAWKGRTYARPDAVVGDER